jgi:hypothetical protein
MRLVVTFRDGSETAIPISHSHTLQVLTSSPVTVAGAVGFDGVAAVSLDHETQPVEPAKGDNIQAKLQTKRKPVIVTEAAEAA